MGKLILALACGATVFAILKWAQYKLTTEALIHMMLSKGMEVDEREIKRHMEICIRKALRQRTEA